jgi:hypothetical protein
VATAIYQRWAATAARLRRRRRARSSDHEGEEAKEATPLFLPQQFGSLAKFTASRRASSPQNCHLRPGEIIEDAGLPLNDGGCHRLWCVGCPCRCVGRWPVFPDAAKKHSVLIATREQVGSARPRDVQGSGSSLRLTSHNLFVVSCDFCATVRAQAEGYIWRVSVSVKQVCHA